MEPYIEGGVRIVEKQPPPPSFACISRGNRPQVSSIVNTKNKETRSLLATSSPPALETHTDLSRLEAAKMDNNNRFHLNLNNGERAPPFNDRAYPTTPSTFPNPIFPSQPQGGQGQGQNAQQQQPYSTGFAPSGYFANSQYPAAYPQPPAASYAQGQQAPQAPQAPPASYQQQRQAPYQTNDATNGLVHQFSHQNLGGRVSPYGTRQPPQGQRPRTAGTTGQQQGYSSYLNAPMPSQASQQQKLPEFQPAPERNPDKYGPVAHANQTKCGQLAETFFKDSVKRARDRNVR